jgi:hypothetical protein
MTRAHAAVAALALLGVGCTGAIGDSAGSPGGPGGGNAGGNSPGQGPPPGGGQPPGAVPDPGTGAPLPPLGTNPLEPDRSSPACKNIDPGPAPLRRLTRAEYDHTVADLIGQDLQLAKDFPPEELERSFDNNAELRSVSDRLAASYVAAAEQVGAAVAANLGKHLACDAARDGEAACLDRFLDGFGARAWRRPLEAAEKDELRKLFTTGRGNSFAEGIDAVVQVLLLSPQFSYRLERGVPVAGAG